MATSRRREESKLTIDHLITEALDRKDRIDEQEYGDDSLEELARKIEERTTIETPDPESVGDVSPGMDEGNGTGTSDSDIPVTGEKVLATADGLDNGSDSRGEAHDGSSSGMIESLAQSDSLEEALDKIDETSREKIERTQADRDRILKANALPFMKRKLERKNPQPAGYLWFCLGCILVGLVWTVWGACTGGQWPVPFFGDWNMICGAFCMVYGGLMLLDLRS